MHSPTPPNPAFWAWCLLSWNCVYVRNLFKFAYREDRSNHSQCLIRWSIEIYPNEGGKYAYYASVVLDAKYFYTLEWTGSCDPVSSIFKLNSSNCQGFIRISESISSGRNNHFLSNIPLNFHRFLVPCHLDQFNIFPMVSFIAYFLPPCWNLWQFGKGLGWILQRDLWKNVFALY